MDNSKNLKIYNLEFKTFLFLNLESRFFKTVFQPGWVGSRLITLGQTATFPVISSESVCVSTDHRY